MFKQIRGVQRHPLSGFAVFQVPRAQNTKTALFVGARSATPQLRKPFF